MPKIYLPSDQEWTHTQVNNAIEATEGYLDEVIDNLSSLSGGDMSIRELFQRLRKYGVLANMDDLLRTATETASALFAAVREIHQEFDVFDVEEEVTCEECGKRINDDDTSEGDYCGSCYKRCHCSECGEYVFDMAPEGETVKCLVCAEEDDREDGETEVEHEPAPRRTSAFSSPKKSSGGKAAVKDDTDDLNVILSEEPAEEEEEEIAETRRCNTHQPYWHAL